MHSCTCTCPLRHLECGDSSLIHSYLLAPGCSDEAGDCTASSWVVPAQPSPPRKEGAQTPAQTPHIKYKTFLLLLPRPCSYLFQLCPLPRRKEASRICFQSSIHSLILHCPAAVQGHFLWLGARQTVFSSTNRHPSASWASLGCYSVIGTISPIPDTSEIHLG